MSNSIPPHLNNIIQNQININNIESASVKPNPRSVKSHNPEDFKELPSIKKANAKIQDKPSSQKTEKVDKNTKIKQDSSDTLVEKVLAESRETQKLSDLEKRFSRSADLRNEKIIDIKA